MKKRTITMCFYGPTDVDEVSVIQTQTQRRTVYYAYNLSMLQLYMARDIIDNGMQTHEDVLVRIDPTSDYPYVIETNGKEESFPFIGIMTRD